MQEFHKKFAQQGLVWSCTAKPPVYMYMVHFLHVAKAVFILVFPIGRFSQVFTVEQLCHYLLNVHLLIFSS